MNRLAEARAIYLLLGTVSGLIAVLLLSLILEPGSPPALLLLDMQDGEQTFPYPLTIQNILLVLFGLGIGDVLHRREWAMAEERAARAKYLPEDERSVLTPADLWPIRQRVLEAQRRTHSHLQALVDQCIRHIHAHGSPEATQVLLTALTELELHRADLRYTLLRYVVWALPTFGFIGTVVGIAGSLGAMAEQGAGREGLAAVLGPLGMAFNSTIMALALSAVLVLLLQLTQRSEESAINASTEYCLNNLVTRIQAPRERR